MRLKKERWNSGMVELKSQVGFALRSLRSQLIGMMEWWDFGMLGLEYWENEVLGEWGNGWWVVGRWRGVYLIGHWSSVIGHWESA